MSQWHFLLLTTIICQKLLSSKSDVSNVEHLWYCFEFSFVITISRFAGDIANRFTSTTVRMRNIINLIYLKIYLFYLINVKLLLTTWRYIGHRVVFFKFLFQLVFNWIRGVLYSITARNKIERDKKRRESKFCFQIKLIIW